MDFDAAAARLQSDHNNLRSRAKNRMASRKLASKSDTVKAKRARERSLKIAEEKRRVDKLERDKQEFGRSIVDRVERQLGVVRSLASAGSSMDIDGVDVANSDGREEDVVMLEAMSVHGQGDKITLPPSILSTLANQDLLRVSQERGQPLFFRLAIPRKKYSFPSGVGVKQMMDDFALKQQQEHAPESSGDISYPDDDMDDDEEDTQDSMMKSYVDELAMEYMTYAYATVVEFTQAEGFIGLPPSVASALLRPTNSDTAETIESKLTVDPASVFATAQAKEEVEKYPWTEEVERLNAQQAQGKADDTPSTTNQNDENQQPQTTPMAEETDEEKTPGHIAYGAFPVPVPKIELSLLTHLPLGTKCSLQPTPDAIRNGFYGLKNIKLALEQSLGRTRGCLNVGDLVHCWFRGKKFDLVVRGVTPGNVGAVSCVNTDIEVDIMEADLPEKEKRDGGNDKKGEVGEGVEDDTDERIPSSLEKEGGYRLSDSTSKPQSSATGSDDAGHTSNAKAQNDIIDLPNLPAEPPKEQTENVIMVQLRGDGGKMSPRRRFDTTTTNIKHLFAFASSTCIENDSSNTQIEGNFRLVTRFPRRVFQFNTDGDTFLNGVENLAKQELFLVEKI